MAEDDDKVLSPRQARQQRREQLRSKSTGLGLLISTKPKSKRFDDNQEEEHDEPEEEPMVKEQVPLMAESSPTGDSDDDDSVVEEVGASTARAVVEEQMEQEQATATVVEPKRKRKKRPVVEKEELDDEFFAELDAEREKDRKESQPQAKSRKTTFVVEGEDAKPVEPIPVEHNIEVVVLEQLAPTLPKTKLSDECLLYSRSRLTDGADIESTKQRQKRKKTGHKVQSTGWKRSRKMNHLLAPGAKKRRTKGVRAPHFVV